MKESIIQKKCIKYFEDKGWFVIKLIQCNKNGMPDLMILKNNKCVFIECKAENGKLSELQKYRHEQLRKQNFEIYTIYSIDEFTKIC